MNQNFQSKTIKLTLSYFSRVVIPRVDLQHMLDTSKKYEIVPGRLHKDSLYTLGCGCDFSQLVIRETMCELAFVDAAQTADKGCIKSIHLVECVLILFLVQYKLYFPPLAFLAFLALSV